MSVPATSLLVARGVGKRFGAVQAIVDVDFDFDVDAGEVAALVSDRRRPAREGSGARSTRPRRTRELLAALGVIQTAQVLELIEHLREHGLAIAVINHSLDNVFPVADRLCVLRLGRQVATFDRRTAAREDVVAAITGAVSRLAAAA